MATSPVTALNTPEDEGVVSLTPTLTFTATDAESDDVTYQVEIRKKYRTGMWVWDFISTVIGDANEENILLNECINSGITDLYCYTFASEIQSGYSELRSFIGKCTTLGIHVWGLDGARAYFSDLDGPQQLFDDVDAINAYNMDSVPDERFYGLMIDIEPPDSGLGQSFHNGIPSSGLSTTPGSGVWQDTEALDREYLMRDWVDIHKNLLAYCHGRDMKMASSITTFLDNYFGEPIECTYDGTTQNVFLHLKNHTDLIALMSYNTNPSTVINRVAYELSHSELPPIGFSAESHTGVGSGISYGDTVGKQTKDAMLEDKELIEYHFLDNLYQTMFNIHDWEGYKALSPVSNDTSSPV